MNKQTDTVIAGERTQTIQMPKMATFTPPLTLANRTKKKEACWQLSDENGVVIANVYCGEAASFLSATFELYQAAVDALSLLQHLGAANDSDCAKPISEDLEDLAFAIAKAEGK